MNGVHELVEMRRQIGHLVLAVHTQSLREIPVPVRHALKDVNGGVEGAQNGPTD
jgi:hypothetical protein